MPLKVLNFQTPIGILKEYYPHLSVFSSLPLQVFGTLFMSLTKTDLSLTQRPLSSFFLDILQPQWGKSVTNHQPKGNLLQWM